MRRAMLVNVLVLTAACVKPSASGTWNQRMVSAQTATDPDPFAPTDPSDPLYTLVQRLNSPNGADLRSQWSIDRAVWNEPVAVDVKGTKVLVTPAFADIHTSIDNVGAVWSANGPLASAPHNPTSARVFLPRGYQNQMNPELVAFAPGGPSTEYDFESRYALESPLLRRGFPTFIINAWWTTAPPIPLTHWGPNFNQVVIHARNMLSRGFGLPAPRHTYGWGQSRGARFLAFSSELEGNPFDGLIEERGGADLVSNARMQIAMFRTFTTVDPVDLPATEHYLSQIGRFMQVTPPSGAPFFEYIPSAITATERFFFKLPPTASVLEPIIPPYDTNPVAVSVAKRDGPNSRYRAYPSRVFDGATWSPGPLSTRRVLNTIDPDYGAAVDNGSVLLRDWDPSIRGPEVQAAIAALTATGRIQTKVIKIHGALDQAIFPQTAIEYIQKIVDSGHASRYRWYVVPGLDHNASMLEEVLTTDTGARVSLGVQLNHLDLLMNWVENGVEPGSLVAVKPPVPNPLQILPTETQSVMSSNQLGLNNSPAKYFWTMSGAAHAGPR